MKKFKFSVALMFLTFTAISLSSCRKDRNETAETIVSAEDNATAENEFTSLFDVADDFSSNDARTRSGNTILPSGAIVTFQDSSFMDGDGVECTIDFGPLKSSAPKGTLCQDGRFRAGKIHLALTKRYFLDSAQVIITINDSDNFYGGSDGVNMTKLSGSVVLTRLSDTRLTIEVKNAKAVNDKGTVTWASNRTITKIVDNGPGILGDQFEIIGSASGVNRNNENFTVVINDALVKKIEMGCARTFIKGQVTLTNVSSGKTLQIDYDPFNNQACDLTAKVTINSKEYFFSVR